MKVAFVTAVWKRPEVFAMFAHSVNKLMQVEDIRSQVQIQCFVAGSEGQRSKTMVEQAGFVYNEVPNQPLANKHNSAVSSAHAWNPDYYFMLGSDDLISPELFKVYMKRINSGFNFIGLLDFYFYDVVTGRAAYWGGYKDKRKGHSVGAGRMIHKILMDKWKYRPFDVRHSSVLDNTVQDYLRRDRIQSVNTFRMKEEGVYAVDIKSGVNMTPLNFKELWHNTVEINPSELLTYFPYIK